MRTVPTTNERRFRENHITIIERGTGTIFRCRTQSDRESIRCHSPRESADRIGEIGSTIEAPPISRSGVSLGDLPAMTVADEIRRVAKLESKSAIQSPLRDTQPSTISQLPQ